MRYSTLLATILSAGFAFGAGLKSFSGISSVLFVTNFSPDSSDFPSSTMLTTLSRPQA